MKLIASFLFCIPAFLASDAFAGPDAFHEGPLIKGYGKIAAVPGASVLPEDLTFKVAWDVAKRAEADTPNRGFDTVARFLNMHNAAGVPAERLHLAIVVHGGAHRDLLGETAYGGDNPNAALIAQLVGHGVQVTLCGQTAAYYGVTADDLLPGVTMSLSAMTAHALLQQEGYTLNPF